ncbi:MAG TPA: cell division protein FtsQ/DivIB [Bryobacteraceae bacterium]|nr:cell division protein FtsQ/DivIB [Bryobacteraceae bacterium]
MAQDAPKKRKPIPTATILRIGGIAIALCSALGGAIYASQRFEQFLIRDPRFMLAGPAEYGLESVNIQLKGVQYASPARILRAFDSDFGRSIYLVPLAARRQAMLNIGWVRDAAVIRVWPDHLIVTVQERKPAAFVKLPAEGMTRWALIDETGAILDPPQKASFHLPVLSGVPAGEPADKRARRVKRMQQLLKDLGRRAEAVSEVDAGDLDDLKISRSVQGHAVTLLMGERNFASRLDNFLEHYPDIHRKMPQAATFDLRLDDRITGLEDGANGR